MTRPDLYSSQHNQFRERLSDLGKMLLSTKELILETWAAKVQAEIYHAQNVRLPILINTMPSFIDTLAQALSPEYPRLTANSFNNIAPEHGAERARLTSYSHYELIKEYQLLRGCIVDVLRSQGSSISEKELMIIVTSIDEAIQISAANFTLAHNKMRDQFIATLTHDLKNPLTAISLAADVLTMKATEPLTLKQSSKITQYCKRMEKMINDLLNQTFINSEGRLRLNLAMCEIQLLVSEVMDELSPGNRDRFHISGEVIQGFWDNSHLRRAIENLVGNALKYSQPGSIISINTKTYSGNMILSIHSSGNEIKEEDQENIFQVFHRSKENPEQPGWGLGLPLVRAVAEAHGGSIMVDSGHAHGTTFTINMPVDGRPFQDKPTLE